MQAEKKRLIKYSAPTKFDKAPYLTLWASMKDMGASDLYVQISEDEELPTWIQMGPLLEKAFDEFFENEKFMKSAIELYRSRGTSSVIKEMMFES